MNKKKLVLYLLILLFCIGLIPLANAQQENEQDLFAFPNVHAYKQYMNEQRKETGIVNKQFERWYHFYGERLGPTGIIPRKSWQTQDVMNRFIEKNTATQRSNSTHNGHWQYIGAGDYQLTGNSDHSGGVGRVNIIEFEPGLPGTFYLGTAAGGLWKTEDSGQSYDCLTNGMVAISVSALAIKPSDTDHIYMAIGDAEGTATNFREVGIVTTTDGGENWYKSPLFFTDPSLRARIYQILIDPQYEEWAYASTSEGLFRTTDSWETLDTILLPPNGNIDNFYWDMDFKPGQSDSLYFCDGSNLYVYQANLDDVDTLLQTPNVADTRLRLNVEVTPGNPDFVYLLRACRNTSGSANPQNGFLAFYFSDDGGNNFRIKSTTPNIMGGDLQGTDDRSQATYDQSLVVNPSDPAELIVGGINLWTSIDTGTTWTCNSYYRTDTTIQYVHADIHDLEYNDFGELFACTDGGVVRSTNDAASWLEIHDGLGINQIYSIDMSEQDIDLTYGGLQDNGLVRFKNDQTMDQVKAGDVLQIVVNPDDADTIVFFRQTGRLYTSFDGGLNTDFVKNWNTDVWECPITFNPNNPQQMFIGTDFLLHYSPSSYADTGSIIKTFPDYLTHLAHGNDNSDRMYVSTSSAMYRINNAYSGFDTFNISGTLPLGTAFISGIAVDPDDADNVWVSFSGFEDGEKVYRSSTAGSLWSNVSDNLPNVPVNCIAYEANSNNGIYVGTDIGVFYTDDDLGHWIYFTNGLPSVVITDLKIHDGAGKIRVATFGRGVWESNLYDQCADNYLLNASNDPSDPDFTGIQRYEANQSIHSTRIITGGPGSDVKYNAGNYILLQPGFHAKHGNLFEGRISPCGDISNNMQADGEVSGRLHLENNPGKTK